MSLLLVTVTAGAQSASDSRRFIDRVLLELNVGAGTRQDGVVPVEFGANIGYKFIPQMYAFVRGGGVYGMYDDSHGQRYTKTQVLGGGLGYTLFSDNVFDLDLRASAMGSLGNADWKMAVYDAGLVARVKPGGLIKVNVGVGYRHIKSRTAGTGSYDGLYVTLGFGF